jgi:hypothetical protein
VELCADSGMSKVPLYKVFLLLRLALNGVELDPLPLDICEACVLCSQGVNIGYDPCITKVEQGVVDYEAVVRGWVKDGEICISEAR